MRSTPPEPSPDTIWRSPESVAPATPPAVPHLADPLRVGNPGPIEEHLVEVDLAAEVAERADLDARLVEVEQEVRDALALRRVGIGAREQHREVGDGAPTWSIPSAR